jgi:hypothetical protein
MHPPQPVGIPTPCGRNLKRGEEGYLRQEGLQIVLILLVLLLLLLLVLLVLLPRPVGVTTPCGRNLKRGEEGDSVDM